MLHVGLTRDLLVIGAPLVQPLEDNVDLLITWLHAHLLKPEHDVLNCKEDAKLPVDLLSGVLPGGVQPPQSKDGVIDLIWLGGWLYLHNNYSSIS